jgi:diacylglycerol O-acyltransferase
MSERLSPLDAAFLDAEDEDPHASLAIASVAVLEGPAPAQDTLVAAIAGKLPLVPRYRQTLRTVPLDLGRPVWVDDPAFDVGYHVRRTALPAPGDDEALCRLVGRLMAQRLDRERPLWECWVVEGLAGGRWAMVSKVHHCMADGIAGTNLYRVLFDPTPEPAPPQPGEDGWTPAAAPSTLRLTATALRDLALNPFDQVRLLSSTLGSPRRVLRLATATARGLAALLGALGPASASSLTGPIGRPRRYALARASLTDIRAVAKRYGVSVNDVVLAAVSGAFRGLLLERGERPDPHAVRSLVPVAVRGRELGHTDGNRISLMLASLPVHVADPVERLTAVHAQLTMLKASREAEAGAAMTELAVHEPFAPISWGIRLAARLPQRSIVTVTTNVPGPRRPLYVLGRPIVEILPYVPIAMRLRTGVAVLTYCDRVAFGVTSDYGSVPEAEAFARAVEHGIADLVAAAAPRQRRRAAVSRPAP